ncbi:MAG: hypothetical protein HZB55_11110 [Deltaproteobacteria bacterium]|nr:hypothetical protein [Deltaproteobacteria bacterium]
MTTKKQAFSAQFSADGKDLSDPSVGIRRAIPLALAAALAAPGGAHAGVTAGMRIGYDSNVDRSVDEPRGEGYGSALVTWGRDAPGEDRLEWTAALSGEATAYLGLEDLDTAALAGEAGLLWVPKAGWTLSAVPFAQARAVRDTDQSAVALGVRAGLRRQLKAAWYVAGSCAYTDSRAREEVYSFREHAVGAALGAEWTPRLSTEMGYQFSRGDSFRAVGDAGGPALLRPLPVARRGPGGPGGNGPRTYASGAFGEDLVSEIVDQHAVGVTLGLQGPGILSWSAGYWYAVSNGDSGTAVRHEVFVGGSLAL